MFPALMTNCLDSVANWISEKKPEGHSNVQSVEGEVNVRFITTRKTKYFCYNRID